MSFLKDLIGGMSGEKKAALIASGFAAGLGLYAELKDGAREAKKQEQITKQEAYRAGCKVAREFYEAKGNPNARRKKRKKSS